MEFHHSRLSLYGLWVRFFKALEYQSNKPLNQQPTALKQAEQNKALQLEVAAQILNSPGAGAEAMRLAEECVKRHGKEIKLTATTRLPANSPEDRTSTYLALYQSAIGASNAEEWLADLEKNHNSGQLMDLVSSIVGVEGRSATNQIFHELIGSVGITDYRSNYLSTLEMMRSLAPEGATQTMLATQMLSVHHLAIRSIASAANAESGSSETTELFTNRAAKLMRLFNQQAELLGRLRGKITQQKIVVEKLDVREGGQALVGTVESSKRGGD